LHERNDRVVDAVRLGVAVSFWVGVFGTAWEWIYARRHGAPVTRVDKIYLVIALPLIFGAQLFLDLVGVATEAVVAGSALAMGIALNGWVLKRRIGRAGSR
jgi:hypothetical protein